MSNASLESHILAEYRATLQTLRNLNTLLRSLNTAQLPDLGDQLRAAEKKMGMVLTLFQTAVYTFSRTREGLERIKQQKEMERKWLEQGEGMRPSGTESHGTRAVSFAPVQTQEMSNQTMMMVNQAMNTTNRPSFYGQYR